MIDDILLRALMPNLLLLIREIDLRARSFRWLTDQDRICRSLFANWCLLLLLLRTISIHDFLNESEILSQAINRLD